MNNGPKHNKVVVSNKPEMCCEVASCNRPWCTSPTDVFCQSYSSHHSRGRDTIRFAEQQESCWRISEEDHEFLLEEASNRAQYDFEIDIDEPSGGSGGDDEEEQHPDDVDVESIGDGSDNENGSESDDAD